MSSARNRVLRRLAEEVLEQPDLDGLSQLLTQELHRFGADSAGVGCLTFAPDGRFALSGGAELALRLWKLSK